MAIAKTRSRKLILLMCTPLQSANSAILMNDFLMRYAIIASLMWRYGSSVFSADAYIALHQALAKRARRLEQQGRMP
jgi:hypothetical protein